MSENQKFNEDPLKEGYGKKLIPGQLPDRYSNLRRFTIWLAMIMPSAVSVWLLPGPLTYMRLFSAPLFFLYPGARYLQYYSGQFVPLWLGLILGLLAHWGVMRITLRYGEKLGVRRALLIPLGVGLLDMAILTPLLEQILKISSQ